MLGVKGLMINYRRLKGSSVSEEFEEKADIYDGSIVNEYADVFLPPSDYSFSFHFYFILTPALKRTFGQRPPLKKFNLYCLTTV